MERKRKYDEMDRDSSLLLSELVEYDVVTNRARASLSVDDYSSHSPNRQRITLVISAILLTSGLVDINEREYTARPTRTRELTLTEFSRFVMLLK